MVKNNQDLQILIIYIQTIKIYNLKTLESREIINKIKKYTKINKKYVW